MEVDPRQAEIMAEEDQRKLTQVLRASENIDSYATAYRWPRQDGPTVKMMLGLIPSPEPRRKSREH